MTPLCPQTWSHCHAKRMVSGERRCPTNQFVSSIFQTDSKFWNGTLFAQGQSSSKLAK